MSTRERIDDLAERIVALRDSYYRGEPEVADADYDALEDEMRELIAAHPELTPDPNPLDAVGAPSMLHAPVRHSRPMLSLEKASKPEQVEAFFDRFPGQPVVVMPKLDGVSLALVYERGGLARAVTRGDGTTGDDVTVLVRVLADGVPDAIDAAGRVEVRGEAVMLRSTFAAYNEAHPDKPLINPRGAAAGTIRAKDPAVVAERRLRFFGFDLDTEDGAHADLEAALRALGFDAADMVHCDTAAEAQAAIAAIEAQRHDLDYDLDGAVLRLADRNAYAAAGTRSNSPRGALAFKYAAEEKTTVLADVVWDVGKTGKVAPVAHLEPVFVGGGNVTRATLANQEVIRARDVRISDVSADRMLESIDRSRGVGLRRALIGLAIPMASEGTAAKLCRAGFRTLEEVADAGEAALQQVEDIGPKVAASIDAHLNREATRAELARLRELGVSLDVREEDLPPAVSGNAPLTGKTVVVTGSLADPRSGEKVPRPAFQRLAQRAGATTASSVSAATDLLINREDVGASKTAKAEKLGVEVVDQGEVWRLLIDAGIA